MRRLDPGYTSEEIKNAFEAIQIDSGCEKGKVHVDALVKFLTTYGSENSKIDFTEDRVRNLVLQIEQDQNGYVDYEEYVNMMMNW